MVMRQHPIPALGGTPPEQAIRPDKTACASEPPCQRGDRAKDVPGDAVRDNGGAGRLLDRQSRARACR